MNSKILYQSDERCVDLLTGNHQLHLTLTQKFLSHNMGKRAKIYLMDGTQHHIIILSDSDKLLYARTTDLKEWILVPVSKIACVAVDSTNTH